MLKILFHLLVTSIVLLVLPGCEDKKSVLVSRTQVIMGTFASISLEQNNADKISTGFQHLADIESILSSYQEEADVYQLNLYKQITANPTLEDILNKSKYYHTLTQGYFDITIGSITKKLYHFGEAEKIPTQQEKSEAVLGIDKVHIQNGIITLDKEITIDLGGIGKGYAVDALSEYYHTLGIDKGQIALSGDIRCLDTCSVGIQDPYNEDKIFTTLLSKIPNLSISTSGTYRRFIKSKDHHHLINPKSKSQGDAFVSVTIVTQADNTLSDVIATAISTMPLELALEFLKSKSNFGYILITEQGKVIKGNLEKFVSHSKF